MRSDALDGVASPKVFISYVHVDGSISLRDPVRNLADRLRDDGVDCNIDQYEEANPANWPEWIRTEINDSDYVLLICCATYRARFESSSAGSGTAWEGAIITSELYAQTSAKHKFIPCGFGSHEENRDYIPSPITSTYYDVSTKEGYLSLYRRLTDQPVVRRPPLGKPKVLPAESQIHGSSKPTSIDIAAIRDALGTTRFEITVEPLILRGLEEARQCIAAREFRVSEPVPSPETYVERVEAYEACIAPLLPALATIARFGDRSETKYLKLAVEKIWDPTIHAGHQYYAWLHLRDYPPLLVTYACGLHALDAENYQALSALMLEPALPREFSGTFRGIEGLTVPHVLPKGEADLLVEEERLIVPGSEYLMRRLPLLLGEIPLRANSFEHAFDRFEYFVSIVHNHLFRAGIIAGRFLWKANRRAEEPSRSAWGAPVQAGLAQGNSWDAIRAGFFSGNFDEAKAAVDDHTKRLAQYPIW